MREPISSTSDTVEGRATSYLDRRVAIAALMLVCAVALFGHLGAPPLFEPDEGRNAEKAREILLLNDWVTPHQNFLVVLDKPISYYWFVAASYKIFGVSEWSARLPSALAALGCVYFLFLFARRFFGFWPGVWAGLVLATSLEFYLLARTVIFDMTLTFFITLALYCFFAALEEQARWRRKTILYFMYCASAAATLVKGPIGVVLPGLVILLYLIFSRKLDVLRTLELPFGIVLFLTIVVPWYYLVETRNPGYLNYFLWEENIARYLTPHFDRRGAWYYFLVVAAVGFFPWTLSIPAAFKQAWRKRRDDAGLFLILWAITPLIFFSFSSTKLPHYILPIFPPLALLTGLAIDYDLAAHEPKPCRLLALSTFVLCLFMIAFILAMWSWQGSPVAAREAITHLPARLTLWSIVGILVFGSLAFSTMTGQWQTHKRLVVGFALGLFVYLHLVTEVMADSLMHRSARDLVKQASTVIDPSAQLVIYDTNLEGLPFYFRTTRPIWVVWSGAKHSVMGSFYLAEQGARPAPGHVRILLTFEEFDKEWVNSPKGQLAVFIKKKNVSRLEKSLSSTAKLILEYEDLVIVTN
jgi:4-amino-4-deoxy-L-arabinose transferase-like glycosyltransferase